LVVNVVVEPSPAICSGVAGWPKAGALAELPSVTMNEHSV
jgi:hypothetical protein